MPRRAARRWPLVPALALALAAAVPPRIAPEGPPEVIGAVEAAVVARVLDAALPSLDACAAAAQERRPALAGPLPVQLVLAVDGRVAAVRFDEPGVQDGPLRACMRGVLIRLQVPLPRSCGLVRVRWPLALARAPGARIRPSPLPGPGGAPGG